MLERAPTFTQLEVETIQPDKWKVCRVVDLEKEGLVFTIIGLADNLDQVSAVLLANSLLEVTQDSPSGDFFNGILVTVEPKTTPDLKNHSLVDRLAGSAGSKSLTQDRA